MKVRKVRVNDIKEEENISGIVSELGVEFSNKNQLVILNIKYEIHAGSHALSQKFPLTPPAALQLSEALKDAVDEYLRSSPETE